VEFSSIMHRFFCQSNSHSLTQDQIPNLLQLLACFVCLFCLVWLHQIFIIVRVLTTLLNKNLRIHCKITRESTKRSLVFHDEGTRVIKENKIRAYVMQQCMSFMPSPTSIYNLIFFKKLT